MTCRRIRSSLSTEQAAPTRWLRLALAASIAASASMAQAQGSGHVGALMEEVLVTAQKKSAAENAQDVPIAISAYSGDKVEAMFAVNLVDIGLTAPNVSLSPQGTVPGVANFIIRGMGTAGQSIPSSDPGVGVVMDGVPFGTIYGVVTDLFDLETVEVLRGPQGTLFGRNVTGGAVVMRSVRPGDEFEGKIKGGMGSHELKEVSARISGPLSENWGGKLAVLAKDRDGLWDNETLGGQQGEQESVVVRPALSFTGDDFDMTAIAEYGNVEGDGPSARNFYLFGVSIDPYKEATSRQSEPGESDLEWYSLAVEANWDVWGGKLTTILGYRDLEQSSWGDVDGAPYTIRFEFADGSGFDQDQQSIEVRWAGDISDRTSLTVGANLFQQDYTYNERRLLVDLLDLRASSSIDHFTAGVFAQADIGLSDDWTLTLGGRYSVEDKDAEIGVIGDPTGTGTCKRALLPPVSDNSSFADCKPAYTDQESWDNFAPKVGVRWDVNDDVMGYASYTRGFRSGGYNVRFSDTSIVTPNPRSTPGPYDEEVVDAYEVGVKSTLLEGRARLNVAVFYNEYDDLQRSANNQQGVQTIFNAATATMQGFEIDTTVLLTDNLALEASYGYVDAQYDEADYLVAARGGSPEDFMLQMAPENTAAAAITYDMALGDAGYLTWRGSVSYTDKAAADDFNYLILDDYTLYDASVSYSNQADNLKVSLYGRNLTDEVYFNFGFDNTSIGSRTMWLTPPRTWGVEVTYTF